MSTVSQPYQPILCCYVNATERVQIARIRDLPDRTLERVVFPGQRLLFEAPPTAELEIHANSPINSILSDIIPCDRLRVGEAMIPPE